jgi:hypothetical protein
LSYEQPLGGVDLSEFLALIGDLRLSCTVIAPA